MSFIIKCKDFTVTDTAGLRGLQTDSSCLAGTKAIFDFSKDTMPDTLAVDDEIENIWYEGNPSVTIGAFSGITSAKGLPFATATTDEKLQLPDDFDLNSYGDTPSLLLSCWIRHGSTFDTTGYNSIAGYAYGTSSQAQWYMSTGNDGLKLEFVVGDSNYTYPAPVADELALLTVSIKYLTSTTYTLSYYKNKEFLYSTTKTYGTSPNPFNVPPGGSYPRLGALALFSSSWIGTVNRISIHSIPDDFDTDSWIENEYDANVGNF